MTHVDLTPANIEARLAAAELVCQIIAGRPVDNSSDEGKALTQAWIDWSNLAGSPRVATRDEFAPIVRALAARRDAIRVKTLSALWRRREQ